MIKSREELLIESKVKEEIDRREACKAEAKRKATEYRKNVMKGRAQFLCFYYSICATIVVIVIAAALALGWARFTSFGDMVSSTLLMIGVLAPWVWAYPYFD